NEVFEAALSEVTRRPHVAWEDQYETIQAGQSLRGCSQSIRQLARSGTRTSWPNGMIASLPVTMEVARTRATHDTTPNRFVRFALDRWRKVIADIDRALTSLHETPAIERGRREISGRLEQLDDLLTHELFKDLGPLTRFPADNQVLQRREGYR